MSADESQLLTRAQVARRLQVSPNTIVRYAEIGLLRPVRIGPRLARFEQSDVERLIRCGREPFALTKTPAADELGERHGR